MGSPRGWGGKAPQPHLKTLLYFSSQPDGSPDHGTSVSVSDPAMGLPPVYVDGQTSEVYFFLAFFLNDRGIPFFGDFVF